MIQANEIRVGNLIKSGRIIVPVDARTIFDIWDSSKKYDPIELTPEILEKAGFKEMKDEGRGIGVFVNGIYDFEETLSGSGIYSLAINEEYINTQIKYLHELQNLYFALTGKELEINTPK